MWPSLGFIYGGNALLHGAHLASSTTLAPGEAIIVTAQLFAFRGARDELRVRAISNGAEGEGHVAVSSELSRTAFAFPLRGIWYDGAAPSLHSHHRWAPMEQFAHDLVQIGPNFDTHRGDGARFADYYAYGQPILAAAAGTVVSAVNDQREDERAMKQPNESQDAYFARLRADQAERLSRGVLGIIGNHVIIDHGNGEFSVYAHMKPGSVRVRAGDHVAQGQQIGQVGSSGNSTEPHLHFQVCNSADALMCAGIPIHWIGLNQVGADLDRAPQTGDFLSGANPPPAAAPSSPAP
jgi:murein DD-endopeptidase MepM/ murein hydrolase activator NlpD